MHVQSIYIHVYGLLMYTMYMYMYMHSHVSDVHVFHCVYICLHPA